MKNGTALAMPASPPRRSAYHHGDLRRALLDAALDLVERQGVATLSLRELAKAAGVTHNAPYRHFADKGALLAAIAEEGFRTLHAEMVKACGRYGDDPEAQFLAIGVTYVRFAVAKPGYFRVMFGPETADRSLYPAVRAAETAAFALCLHAVREGQAAGVIRPGDANEFALAAWAVVHGLAALILDGFIAWTGLGDQDSDQLARLIATRLFLGMAPV